MTAKNIQRAAVRMLYDPSLVERVYSQPDKAWPDLNLSVEERAWLVRPDRRRWRCDPARRQRSLQVIIEEFPVSVGLCLRDTSLVDLQAYFGSSIFHRCVNEDGSMVACFGDWLRLQHSSAEQFIILEQGIARARRRCLRQLRDFDSCWTMCRHVDVVEVFPDTLGKYQDYLHGLGATPTERIEALLAGCTLSPGPSQTQDDAEVALVIEYDTASNVARMSEANSALSALLNHLRTPKTFEIVCAFAKKYDLDVEECAEILADLAADRLIFQIF